MASSALEIYTIGGGEILEFIFNGIAMFFTGDKPVASRVIQIAAIFGGFWVVISMVLKNNLFIGPKWFLFYLVASELLFAKTATVAITDTTDQLKPRLVSHVPMGLAYVASYSSRLGIELTKKFEQNFSVVDDIQYTKTGMVFGSKLVGDMLKLTISDARFQQNLYHYIDRCITNIATIGHKYDWPKLKSEPNVWKFVTETNKPSPLWKFIYKDKDDKSQLFTCEEGAPILTGEWQSAYSKFDQIYSKKNVVEAIKDGFSSENQATMSLSNQVKGVLASNFGYLSNMKDIAGDADALLRQALMLNSIVDSTNSKTMNYAATKALIQQKNHYQTVGYLAQDALPVIKVVLDGVVYGAFVIVLLFALLPGGWNVLVNYTQLIVWLQLWAPLYAILHGIMMKVAQFKTASLASAYGGYTMMNALGIVNYNSNIYATAGYLSMSVPYLAHIILKGGVQSFVHMSSHLGSGFQSAAASASAEVTSGNLSQGNVQYGNTSALTMSAFQQSASPHMNKGHFSRVRDDGSIHTTTLDGRDVFKAGAGFNISTFKTHMELGSSMQQQINKSRGNEESFMATQQKSLNKVETIALKNATTFGDAISKGVNKGEQYNINTSSGESMSIQNMLSLNKDIQKRLANQESQGANAHIGVGVNTGINAGGGYSTNATREQTSAQYNNLNDSEQSSKNLDYMYRVAKNTNFGEHQSVEAKAARDFVASYDKMQSLSESISKSRQSIDRYNYAESKLETSGINSSENLDQEFFDYIKEQKGAHQAVQLLGLGGEFIRPYKEGFIEQKMSTYMATIDQDLKSHPEKIAQKYNDYKVGQLDDSELKKHEGKFDKVQHSGQIDSTQHKQIIDKKISGTKAKAEDKREYYEKEKEVRSGEFKENYKKNIGKKIYKNIVKK